MYLPGGGSFDVPLPGNTTLRDSPMVISGSTCPTGTWIPLLVGGLVLGAGATWLILRRK